ncbi:MAG TPA: DUF1569 domain-containing protein [Blastocatellia bacterium]|nr:DUF1569 domain-containing protein [Blastocatellia bacterium]HMX29912.1 DUF1569 domain-containing protein [Blastocatellia bacterium]HMY75577.1 DUF1569 domain-containing protein [Blastocatellia bacterium]HMZ19921.1 DUF1569 domain-containing protein [Blastocatellia bacterium]HNG32707.1 DUF1569 domain-containing protein [Blastocatellia bacterium]
MKKTFSNQHDKTEILERLKRMRPDSQRQWGRMTAHQAICHLEDSFKCRTGEKPSSTKDNWFSRSVMKWVALQSPMPWPHGIQTMPEFDQEIGGTPPEEFERDRIKLEMMIEKFCHPSATNSKPHPIFGQMTEAEWLRWGYLHCDHHLRQFGV